MITSFLILFIFQFYYDETSNYNITSLPPVDALFRAHQLTQRDDDGQTLVYIGSAFGCIALVALLALMVIPLRRAYGSTSLVNQQLAGVESTKQQPAVRGHTIGTIEDLKRGDSWEKEKKRNSEPCQRSCQTDSIIQIKPYFNQPFHQTDEGNVAISLE